MIVQHPSHSTQRGKNDLLKAINTAHWSPSEINLSKHYRMLKICVMLDTPVYLDELLSRKLKSHPHPPFTSAQVNIFANTKLKVPAGLLLIYKDFFHFQFNYFFL